MSTSKCHVNMESRIEQTGWRHNTTDVVSRIILLWSCVKSCPARGSAVHSPISRSRITFLIKICMTYYECIVMITQLL